MTHHDTTIAASGGLTKQPRAVGAINVSAKFDTKRGSVLGDLRMSGAMKALFPRPRGSALDVTYINSAGGITGGDNYQIEARAEAGAQITLTSQAAERAYRAQTGETAQVSTVLQVENGARMNWLPQETILFDGCNVDRILRVDLASDAEFLLCEPLVFGRDASGETLTNARFCDRIEIYQNGAPLYFDAMHLEGDIMAHLGQNAVANGARADARIVFVSPKSEMLLPKIRDMLPTTGGASLIRDTVLGVRILACDSYELRRSLLPILDLISEQTLPLSWRL